LQESTATLAFQKYMQADPLCGERQENTHDFCSHHWIIWKQSPAVTPKTWGSFCH
jgi:hypothetical protein